LKEDYIATLAIIPDLCTKLRQDTIRNWFTFVGSGITESALNKYYPFSPAYQKLYEPLSSAIQVCDLLGIPNLESEHSELLQRVALLGNALQRNEFETHLTYISNVFTNNATTIPNQLAKLRPTEIGRVNEAIHCLVEGCYFSTVAMAVTAIESRLLGWMQKVNPTDQLDALTLGQLVNKVVNEKQYSDTFPNKHKPLLQLCNQYRVFSVHPKAETINKRVASSILNLSLEFLFDETLV
jgi:hypothetical protein